MMLPVDAVLPDLAAALRARASAVLVAPPGAGKTTRAPLALMQEPWARGKRLILLSPRRVAARAAAARMAAQLGEPVGQTVGYRVRLDSKVSAATRIEVVTEGVFTRQILADPLLDGVAGVLFDEFHERSLEADLALALALDTQGGLREDLRLVVMSATLDAAAVADLLGAAPVIESAGRLYPITTLYRPRRPDRRLEDDVADAVLSALAAEPGGVLAFLPGVAEIERTHRALTAQLRDPRVEVARLYGGLEPALQDQAIAPPPPGRRKVVLASAIAETSLTIEDVRIVIDAGLSRQVRHEPELGVSRLETVRASIASVDQRRGRAGRTQPGVCVRLWEEGETRSRPAFDPPEILQADLAGLRLDLASWGVAEAAQLRWMTPPPAIAWAQAEACLAELGALDADKRLTEHGRRLGRAALPPRLAHMVLSAPDAAGALCAALIAVLLGEDGLGGRDTDIRTRVEALERDRGPRAQAARRLAQRIAHQAGFAETSPDRRPDAAGLALARAFPDRIAKARGGGVFQLANGRQAALDPADPLAREPALVAADVSGRAERARIRIAAPLSLAALEEAVAHGVRQEVDVTFDPARQTVRARQTRRFRSLLLMEAPTESPPPEAVRAALLQAVRGHGLAILPWDEAAAQLRGRVALLRGLEGESWPDLSEGPMTETLEDWLAPALQSARGFAALNGRMAALMLDLVPHALRRRLETEAPPRLETPAGGSALIDYGAEHGPAVDVRLQELFGLDRHPSVASGRVPLLLRLTSPAGRPVQTTRDLPGFWRGSYAAVRAEMRGRYPKHPWPEDPISAAPTRRAKPRP